MQRELVLVTGASGFIATHCILKLLEAGYRVRGTVRNRKRCKQIEEGLAAHIDIGDRLSFATADLTKDEGWEEAAMGASYVLHIASPLPTKPPKDEMELIGPAREGALRVLRAAQKAGVRRVVLTSSLAAVASGHRRTDRHTYTEADWSNLSGKLGAYDKSKTLAERAAWDFVADLGDKARYALTTINPGVVLGPTLIPDYSMSQEFVGKLLRREVPGCPNINVSIADVREVAAAHVAAMERPSAEGKRFVLGGKSTAMRDIALILKGEYGPKGYRIPTMRLPDILVRLVAFFDPAVGLIVPELGLPTHVSSAQAERLLDFSHRPLRDMVVETAESLIASGLA